MAKRLYNERNGQYFWGMGEGVYKVTKLLCLFWYVVYFDASLKMFHRFFANLNLHYTTLNLCPDEASSPSSVSLVEVIGILEMAAHMCIHTLNVKVAQWGKKAFLSPKGDTTNVVPPKRDTGQKDLSIKATNQVMYDTISYIGFWAHGPLRPTLNMSLLRIS